MEVRITECIETILKRVDDPESQWLCCGSCKRFFQYRDRRDREREWGCPFCHETYHQIFVWDNAREADDPRWPRDPSELRHGMRAPEMESYYDERARRQRADILRRFVQSPEWKALGRDDLPLWTEHMLYTYWTWTIEPHELSPELMEDHTGLFGFWCDASPDDAGTIIAELNAYFTFAGRALDHPDVGRCLSLVSGPDAVDDVRSGIEAAMPQRKRGCTRLVRDGRACRELMGTS